MLDVLALGPEARMVLGFQLMDASTTAAAVALGSSSHIGFCGVHGKPFVEVPLQSGVRGVCSACWRRAAQRLEQPFERDQCARHTGYCYCFVLFCPCSVFCT